jgi:hypothetical protein
MLRGYAVSIFSPELENTTELSSGQHERSKI